MRTQLEDSRKFQDQVLATVYWSLGTLATVAVLLVGFGWFANVRIYERDKLALERELRAQLLDEHRKVREESAALATEKFTAQDKALAEGIAAAETRFRDRIEAASSTLDRTIGARIDAGTSDLQRLRNDVRVLRYEAQLQERVSWLAQKLLRNALQKSTIALKLANEIGFDYRVASVLDLVTRDIDAVLVAKANPIDNFLVAQLVEALEAVTGAHAHAAATIKAKTAGLLGA